jgi:hypothetical protein
VGRLGQIAPLAYAPPQNMEILNAMREMEALPASFVKPMVFTDPNLLSEVCFRFPQARCICSEMHASENIGARVLLVL